MNFDWVVAANSLCLGNAETVIKWNEVDGTPLNPPASAILACEINDNSSVSCLDAFLAGKSAVSGVIVKVARLADARKISHCDEANNRCKIFGVIFDYYTCHVPVTERGARKVFRYYLGLRRISGIKSIIKQGIKIILVEAGLGAILCDYFLVLLERKNNDY